MIAENEIFTACSAASYQPYDFPFGKSLLALVSVKGELLVYLGQQQTRLLCW